MEKGMYFSQDYTRQVRAALVILIMYLEASLFGSYRKTH